MSRLLPRACGGPVLTLGPPQLNRALKLAPGARLHTPFSAFSLLPAGTWLDPSPFGAQLRGGTGGTGAQVGRARHLAGLDQSTVIAAFTTDGLTSGISGRSIYCERSDSTQIFKLTTNPANNAVSFVFRNSSAQLINNATSAAWSSSYKIHIGAFITDGSASRTAWCDGDVATNTTNYANSFTTANDIRLVGDSQDAANSAFNGGLLWVLADPRVWGDRELLALLQDPFSVYARFRSIWVPVSAGGGGNVTVNLSGISASFAQTAPAVSSTVFLVGENVAASAGALLPAFSFSLLGQAGAASAGTLSPSTSRALSGQSAAFAAGSVIPSVAIAAIGLQATFSAGTLTASSSAGATVALTGESATFVQTAPSISVTVALTGIAATMAAGILSSSSGTATITVKAGSWLRYKKLQ